MALAVAPLIEVSAQQGVTVDPRPNIVLFMVDDMGWQDTSLPFWVEKTPLNRRYHTPNMERLASEGMMFTQAYACSVSSPSRVSLMSGMNAARHRVTNWTLEKNTSTDRKSPVLDFPAWNVNGICQVDNIPYTYCITSLPQLLKDAGYHTIHCGKAHWGLLTRRERIPIISVLKSILRAMQEEASRVIWEQTILGIVPTGNHRRYKLFPD